ncbi:hypothetical protein RFI_02017 [Reticulomyxa filosa]|uniref:Uncharacterized protein n=1 Tax=Reticulomyxa filosa TaxID=46433 RepID=X6PA52_RETFI|nr:hypothetical protein RFI_02017 [Reticulomyxa filosa]|eukprot:ETO35056.1 hypothetical protein RFI_02017 [Reticulomyxa filosa]
MQGNSVTGKNQKHAKEIKILARLFSEVINKEELQRQIELHNGNIELVIKDIVRQLAGNEEYSESEAKADDLKNMEQVRICSSFITIMSVLLVQISESNKAKHLEKGKEKTEIEETKPGISLQGYCTNENCLVSKGKLLVWVNLGFDSIIFVSGKTLLNCPDCKRSTITSIVKAMFYNSEHSICASGDSIHVKDNNHIQ